MYTCDPAPHPHPDAPPAPPISASASASSRTRRHPAAPARPYRALLPLGRHDTRARPHLNLSLAHATPKAPVARACRRARQAGAHREEEGLREAVVRQAVHRERAPVPAPPPHAPAPLTCPRPLTQPRLGPPKHGPAGPAGRRGRRPHSGRGPTGDARAPRPRGSGGSGPAPRKPCRGRREGHGAGQPAGGRAEPRRGGGGARCVGGWVPEEGGGEVGEEGDGDEGGLEHEEPEGQLAGGGDEGGQGGPARGARRSRRSRPGSRGLGPTRSSGAPCEPAAVTAANEGRPHSGRGIPRCRISRSGGTRPSHPHVPSEGFPRVGAPPPSA